MHTKAKVSLRQLRIFSEPLKRKIVHHIEQGKASVCQASREYRVSLAAFYQWLNRFSRNLHSQHTWTPGKSREDFLRQPFEEPKIYDKGKKEGGSSPYAQTLYPNQIVMKALTLSKFGSSDVLEYREISDPVLNAGEILVEMKAIGLNFADLMRRNGVYPMRGKAPYINGFEGAGIVKDNNTHPEIKMGDRVAFADVPFANAELVAVPLENAIPLPNEISFETAASIMLQGLTAHYLSADSHKINSGETALIHAAAGGVGQLLTQVCKILGAKVIGLVSSESKKEIALSLGADAVFLYDQAWKTKVLEICPAGVDVVYESIGSTMEQSLAVTKILGQVVFFGLAGGKLELGNPLWIIAHSKTITGADLWNYLTSRSERLRRSKQLFDWVISGKIKITPPTIFKLSEGKEAHDYMEGRISTGKILMKP